MSDGTLEPDWAAFDAWLEERRAGEARFLDLLMSSGDPVPYRYARSCDD
ncbi:hypothetical protein SEA_MULCH_2 [Gordonia phage Mulch]|uniref:Uncharacterized protein n=5 Tax=Betterkatzvirus betterkatz TaxID=2560485 RepID=A0A2Z5HDI1_9CAUD|nr:hypothetical protein SEA_NADEEM_2 [Gordonia phage Nadeem]AZS11171.1 hypothetical protein PBI_WHEATTHIN_2 [Gordonia phage WheatThin]QAU06801.1 hypothetical protein SEA_BRYLIE_2 [Gordonia phage Brylie]QAX92498.1 hypothetical protein SEA_MULCH_2 [Gordonia phage Mulch]QAY06459.1 hypothetical protein SEA_PARADA_2 [Gordonia phage Parada]